MHEHFDADDRPCPAAEAFYTVVTREPEWDDSSRGRAFRIDEIERDTDSETGLPRADAYRDQPFIVHHDVINYAAKAAAKERARLSALHKDDDGWLEGRRFVAVPATPEQIEAARKAQENPDQD